ncbi:MAG: hypothetical protein ACR2QJ_14390 [Geminicoccaceae bacterium]
MTGTRSLVIPGVAGALMVLLVGCVPGDVGDDAASSDIKAAEAASDLPKGAMPMSGGVYAVPIGVDTEGCEQFSAWSAEGVVQQIIHYHDGQGGFTPIKSIEHSCQAAMVEIGKDEKGCSIYRAEQPNGAATETVYYRGESGYSIRPEHADCAN